MQIGILSDSHDDPFPVRKALALFDSLGVTHLIHCGDVGGQGVFDEFVGRALTFVWGNTDVYDGSTLAYLETVGLRTPTEVPTTVTLDDKRFAVFHGHENGFDAAPHRLKVDYICHGHSHLRRDEHVNGIRIINPGALHRARVLTVATLDTTTDELTFHTIE